MDVISHNKAIIMLMLPVMKELEKMGINPIENMSGEQTMEVIENRYIAINKAKEKYPLWYKEASKVINDIFKSVTRR